MTENEFIDAVKRNHQRLFLIALSYTKNQTDAQDILQNTFLKLWKHPKPFKNAEHLDRWLTRVAVNESKNLLRSPFKSRSVPLEEADDRYDFAEAQDHALFHAVMRLPQKQRTVIHLFYYEDMSVKEIAETLGIRVNAVKTRLSRGRTQLKDILGDDWNDA